LKTGKNCFTLILFGLSGSGKSTLAFMVHEYLLERNISVELLDADEYRKHLSPNATYTEADRNTFRRKLFFISSLLNRNNISSIIPMISSDSEVRKYARDNTKNLFEVYLNTTIETCIDRDPKGLYKKVNGKFRKNIVGIDIPFNQPSDPDLVLDTGKFNISESFNILMDSLKGRFEI